MSYSRIIRKLVNALMILLCISFAGFAPVETQWKPDQLEKANTGKYNNTLSAVEKEAIQYVNLARMYPQLFVKIELKDYTGPTGKGCYSTMYVGSSYKASLVKHLEAMKPVPALSVEQYINDNASCFSNEIGISGQVGHTRKHCPESFLGECISFGMVRGKDIVMQLLIDEGIKSLGHREVCLDVAYTKIGASVHDHTKCETCAVIGFDR